MDHTSLGSILKATTIWISGAIFFIKLRNNSSFKFSGWKILIFFFKQNSLTDEKFIFLPLPEYLSGAVTTAEILTPSLIRCFKQSLAKSGVP